MSYDLCAIGNALVDIIVTTDDAFLIGNNVTKGSMTLVDETRSRALFDAAGPAAEMASGGSAANTLAGAASLGAACAFMGKVGRDSFGEIFTHDMRAQMVHFTTPPSPELATGRCLSFVTPDAQRSMSTFLGAAVEFGPDDVDPVLLRDSRVTYLEGYLFDRPLAQAAFRKAAQLVHQADCKLSLSLSDTFCVERHREAFLDLVRGDVDILFANEHEIKALYQSNDLEAALRTASTHTDITIVTRGAASTLIVEGHNRHDVAAHPVMSLVDTTGAGDQYAAGFLYGYTVACRLSRRPAMVQRPPPRSLPIMGRVRKENRRRLSEIRIAFARAR